MQTQFFQVCAQHFSSSFLRTVACAADAAVGRALRFQSFLVLELSDGDEVEPFYSRFE